MESKKAFLEDLLGCGPYPFPLGSLQFDQAIGLYQSTSVCMIKPRVEVMDQEAYLAHAHNSYEFTIPFNDSPLLTQDKQIIRLTEGKMLPCNPGQMHGPAERVTKANFVAIVIQKEFLDGLAKAINIKERLWFNAEPFSPSQQLLDSMRSFMEEQGANRLGKELFLDTLEVQIALHLLREASPQLVNTKRISKTSCKRNIIRAIEMMRGHFDEEFSSEAIAHHAHMSRFHFFRVFKAHTGKTPYEYLTGVRLEKAMKMLLNSDLNINEICYSCGFSSHSHFTTVFRKRIGMTPTQFRQKHGIQTTSNPNI